MLPHYSPLKVAETFSLLSALYPGRIDLAVGRAAGTDPMTAYALQRDRRAAAPDDFPEQLTELLCYMRDGFPAAASLCPAPTDRSGEPFRPATVVARIVAAERHLGGGTRVAVRVCRLHLPGRRGRGVPLSRVVRTLSHAVETLRDCRSVGAVRRNRARRRIDWPPAHEWHLRISWPARRFPSRQPKWPSNFSNAIPRALAAVAKRRRAILGTPDVVRDQLSALAADIGG